MKLNTEMERRVWSAAFANYAILYLDSLTERGRTERYSAIGSASRCYADRAVFALRAGYVQRRKVKR